MSEPAGLTFLRRVVEQGRLTDIGDLRLMLKDFADLEQQDEIHWKTRRKLLKDIDALEAKLSKMEEALDAANFESLSSDATAASVQLVIREALAGGEEA